MLESVLMLIGLAFRRVVGSSDWKQMTVHEDESFELKEMTTRGELGYKVMLILLDCLRDD
jgi:hypothetical protein